MNIDRGKSYAIGAQLASVSPTELYEVIVGASSQDFGQVRASSQRLKQLLDKLGAYNALHEIAARRDIPLPVRQQAIIQFKNAVPNHWRSRRCAFVSLVVGYWLLYIICRLLTDEHRGFIRQRCLSFIDEADDTASLSTNTLLNQN